MSIERKKIINNIKKWNAIEMDLFFVNLHLSECYKNFSLGDYEDKKKLFYFII